MFSYYGTKKKIAKYYPKPKYDKIIEPFAGAAQYSLFEDNWKKDVMLIDIYDIIIDTWNYLIRAKESDILSLPDMEYEQNIDMHTMLSKEEKYLIGFCINSGSAQPKKTVKKYNSWNKTKIDIANNLYKIRHWKTACAHYEAIPNQLATWYIDPPYSDKGVWYRHNCNKIDYSNLAEWSKNRMGQVIVCENVGADWLPFEPLVKLQGQKNSNVEAIWIKDEIL